MGIRETRLSAPKFGFTFFCLVLIILITITVVSTKLLCCFS